MYTTLLVEIDVLASLLDYIAQIRAGECCFSQSLGNDEWLLKFNAVSEMDQTMKQAYDL